MTTVGATSQGQQPQTQQSDLQQNQNTTQIKNSDKKTTDVDQKEEEKKPTEINESNTNLIINYLPPEMDENALASLLKPFGQYENLKIVIDLQSGKSRGYGFVKYSNSETAKKVIEGLNGQSHGNKKLKVTYARPQCKEIQNANLYVTNVPAHFTETELKDLFAPIGHVVECRVLKDASTSKNVGYVRMNTHVEAENAIKLRDNHIIEEGLEPLSVKFAQRRTSKNNNRGWNNNNDNNDNNNYNNFNNNNNYNNNYNYNNNNNPNFNRQNRPQNFNNINNNRRPNRGGGNRVGSPYRQSQGPMDGMQNMQQQFNNNRGSRDSPFRGGGGRGRSQGRQYRQRNDRSNQNAGPGLYMYDQFQGPPSNMQPFYQGQPSGLPMGPNNQMLAQQQFNSNNTRQTFNIIAYNIPPKYTVDHLIQVYAPYGPIHSVNIVPNSPKGSYGIISYFFYDDAQRAQNETNGRRIENTRLDVVFQK